VANPIFFQLYKINLVLLFLWELLLVLEEFFELKDREKICFVAKMFGNYYAYRRTFSEKENYAIEIARSNIEELRKIGGYAIKVLPTDIEEGLKRIKLNRNQGVEDRTQELISEFCAADDDVFDFVFRNNYDEESLMRFFGLIKSLD
jgi:hypothetical protein